MRLAVLGGSETYGTQNNPNDRWSSVLQRMLQAIPALPCGKACADQCLRLNVSVTNLATPSCDVSCFRARHLRTPRVQDVLRRADGILIDFGLNDRTTLSVAKIDTIAEARLRAAYAGLVADLRRCCPNAALMFLLVPMSSCGTDHGCRNEECPEPQDRVELPSTIAPCPRCADLDHNHTNGSYVFCKRLWSLQHGSQSALRALGVPYWSYRDTIWPRLERPPDSLPLLWDGMSHPGPRTHWSLAYGAAHLVLSQLNFDGSTTPKAAFLRSCREKTQKKTQYTNCQMVPSNEKNRASPRNWQYGALHANAPHKLAWTGSVGAPIVFQRSFGVVPILQLAYYASYLTEYGTAVIWVGHDRHINVTIESRWQLKQTVVQVVSVSATKAVADRIKDGPRTLVLPSLRPGVHPVGLMVVPHSGAGAAQPTFKLDALHGCELAEVSGLG